MNMVYWAKKELERLKNHSPKRLLPPKNTTLQTSPSYIVSSPVSSLSLSLPFYNFLELRSEMHVLISLDIITKILGASLVDKIWSASLILVNLMRIYLYNNWTKKWLIHNLLLSYRPMRRIEFFCLFYL